MGLRWSKLILGVFVFCVAHAAVAQQFHLSAALQDSFEISELRGKRLDSVKLQKYSNKYNYRTDNKREIKVNEIQHQVNKNGFLQSWISKEWVQALLYAFVILILFGALLYLLFKKQSYKAANNTVQNATLDKLEGIKPEELQNANIHEMLELCLESGDFKGAVRVQYLRILQLLMQKNWIFPSVEKTNYSYVQELKGNKVESEFFQITVLFEKIWYGNSDITAADYKGIVPDFDNLFNQIRLT